MKICPVCNKRSENPEDRFCEECGVMLTDFADDNGKEEPKKISKSIIAIVMLAVLLVAAIVIIVILLMKTPGEQSTQPDSESITHIYEHQSVDTIVRDEQIQSQTIKPEATTTSSVVSADRETTTAPRSSYPLVNDPYQLHADGYYIVANTPDGKGLNVYNYLPSESIESRVINHINDGDVVLVLTDYSSLDDGYVYILSEIGGWVEANFLHPYNPYESHGYTYKDVKRGMLCRVKFSTPDHAGLNMRAQTNSESELLCLLTEGTVLDVLDEYDPSNHGYIKVGYNHPHAGEYFEGWILAEYIDYYGYKS